MRCRLGVWWRRPGHGRLFPVSYCYNPLFLVLLKARPPHMRSYLRNRRCRDAHTAGNLSSAVAALRQARDCLVAYRCDARTAIPASDQVDLRITIDRSDNANCSIADIDGWSY